MTLLRQLLSVFAIVNVAFWAILAWTWAVRPAWAARLPFGLGTHEHGKQWPPTGARLAAAVAAFWAVAAVLYVASASSNQLAFVALFVMSAVFLILGIGAAARIYRVLQLPDARNSRGRQQAL